MRTEPDEDHCRARDRRPSSPLRRRARLREQGNSARACRREGWCRRRTAHDRNPSSRSSRRAARAARRATSCADPPRAAARNRRPGGSTRCSLDPLESWCCEASSSGLCRWGGDLLEDLEQGGEVTPLVPQFARELEHLVGAVCGRERDLEPSCLFEGELDVLLHEAQVEPRLVGWIEEDRSARLEHRRADRALRHDLERPLPVEARSLREEESLGKREHLDGEADVDRELEDESVAVRPDVV